MGNKCLRCRGVERRITRGSQGFGLQRFRCCVEGQSSAKTTNTSAQAAQAAYVCVGVCVAGGGGTGGQGREGCAGQGRRQASAWKRCMHSTPYISYAQGGAHTLLTRSCCWLMRGEQRLRPACRGAPSGLAPGKGQTNERAAPTQIVCTPCRCSSLAAPVTGILRAWLPPPPPADTATDLILLLFAAAAAMPPDSNGFLALGLPTKPRGAANSKKGDDQ